mmetsp:Transcript_31462/g.74780  ORF Transcript_31462/g.74780 Transcript_31462/m.74780 type:complete len:202 (+) Transcript_31462:124-729(+)
MPASPGAISDAAWSASTAVSNSPSARSALPLRKRALAFFFSIASTLSHASMARLGWSSLRRHMAAFPSAATRHVTAGPALGAGWQSRYRRVFSYADNAPATFPSLNKAFPLERIDSAAATRSCIGIGCSIGGMKGSPSASACSMSSLASWSATTTASSWVTPTRVCTSTCLRRAASRNHAASGSRSMRVKSCRSMSSDSLS